jgi:hypothetical protein
VTSATELSSSTTDETSLADALRSSNTRRVGNTSRDGAANVTTSDRVNALDVSNVTQHDQARSDSISQSRTSTESASSRATQDHKISFTVATVSGSEDFTSRIIENQSADHAMRVDYWKRMLRWHIRLERIDVRLTYSITLPDPAYELRQPYIELQQIEADLSQGFNFDLNPATITEAIARDLSSTYHVTVPGLAPAAPAPALVEWQSQVWAIVRSAAWNQFTTAQGVKRNRRDVLLKGLSNSDPLRLRRLEQEQITRKVVQWLFPRTTKQQYSESNTGIFSVAWEDALEYGAYISFVHQSIDWDNLLISLYPYFWDDTSEEQGKMLFDHPDPVHCEFLRAGAAKVTLPIQPGFESDIISLLEYSEIKDLPASNGYRKVVEQVQSEHKARQSSGPDRLDEWEECTPTGAMDLDVVLSKVTGA